MLRTMLTSKIHRATVTQADLHYVGSLTVDADLLDAAGLLPGEQVHVVDIDNGARLVTYTIAGPRGSGIIGINGAAARLVHQGDLVIIIAYGQLDDAEARTFQPRVVHVDRDNRIVELGHDLAAPPPGSAAPIPGPVAPAPGSTAPIPNPVAPAPGSTAPIPNPVAPAPGSTAPIPNPVAPGSAAPIPDSVVPASGSAAPIPAPVAPAPGLLRGDGLHHPADSSR